MVPEPRACLPDELPALTGLCDRVFRAEGGSMAAEYPLLFDPENREHLRVIEQEGGIVAHVGICLRDAVLLGVPLRVASIGAVCTNPAFRGQGLATRLMEDARRHAEAYGADLLLISGGRGLYRRMGYVRAGRFPRYRVTRATPSSMIAVAPFAAPDLPAVRALHEREPVRFRRSAQDWERLLKAGMLMNQPARLWVARQGNAIVGYLGVQEPARRAADGDLGPARAMEYAGERWAVADAAGAILADMRAQALELVGPGGDLALAAQAAARGWEAAVAGFPGTLAILRPAAFWTRLRPLIAERLGERRAAGLAIDAADGGVRLSLEGQTLALESPGEFAQLLFGAETPSVRDRPDPHGVLGEALDALVPLPLLWYGYNYV